VIQCREHPVDVLRAIRFDWLVLRCPERDTLHRVMLEVVLLKCLGEETLQRTVVVPWRSFTPLNSPLGTVARDKGILAVDKVVEEGLDVALGQ